MVLLLETPFFPYLFSHIVSCFVVIGMGLFCLHRFKNNALKFLYVHLSLLDTSFVVLHTTNFYFYTLFLYEVTDYLMCTMNYCIP